MNIQQNVALAQYTTLKIGGPARYFAEVATENDLRAGLAYADQAQVPVFLLGGGSNLVVADSGYPGLVLQIATPSSIERRGDLLDVSAGTEWDDLVRYACEADLFGMECLAGIPGRTGGSPIQNIGAYGQEVSQTIRSITAYDRETRAIVQIAAQDCGFAYRESIFNGPAKNRYVILRVLFQLAITGAPNLDYRDLAPLRGTNPSAFDVYTFVRRIRAGKGMLIDPQHPDPDSRSAGSFFRNPVVTQSVFTAIASSVADDVPHWPTPAGQVKLSAAWLIERAGFPKGFRLGAVGVSTRHTLALTNRGDATTDDLLALARQVRDGVATAYGIVLEAEPVLVGCAL